MIDARVSLGADNADPRAAPRMKWVGDYDLDRRKAGIMSLLRPALANRISPQPSARR
jgi:hypothetical protein